MGGCRCTFRGCPNNSANSPGMHFFHYPLKYPERLQKWVEYADTKDFLSLPASKARNKVVCETHFRDECFMNYKKERLVQFAIPTLVRFSNGLVLDYEESESPKPKALEPTKSKHLIRPGSSSGSSAEATRSSAGEEEYIIESLEDIPPIQSQKRTYSHMDSGNDTSLKNKISKLSPPPKILNSSLRNYSAAGKSHQTAPKILNEKTIHPAPSEDFSSNMEFCEQLTIEPVEENEEHVAVAVSNILLEDCPEEEVIHVQEVEEYSKSLESDKISKSVLDEVVNDYEAQIKELMEKLNAKEAAEKAKTTQVETVSTSRTPANNTSGAITKAQLFNGIKKYLSPSMATLVRMEMFGGPERQWKPDEKQVAVELLKLGDQVFNYFRDEWRFRLPSKKDVQQWLSTCDGVEEEEDL